ncbi:MAG: hypothetical protein OSA97_11105 [Nevskia sp.]|nr:hypothetical protein [Nevskia sp.]
MAATACPPLRTPSPLIAGAPVIRIVTTAGALAAPLLLSLPQATSKTASAHKPAHATVRTDRCMIVPSVWF